MSEQISHQVRKWAYEELVIRYGWIFDSKLTCLSYSNSKPFNNVRSGLRHTAILFRKVSGISRVHWLLRKQKMSHRC